MFDLDYYQKSVDNVADTAALVELFLKAMQHLGYPMVSFQLLPGDGNVGNESSVHSSLFLVKNSQPQPDIDFQSSSFDDREESQRAAASSCKPKRAANCESHRIAEDTNAMRQISIKGSDSTTALLTVLPGSNLEQTNDHALATAENVGTVYLRKYQSLKLLETDQVSLTCREAQILQLASIGETKRSIAHDLGVTNHAVDFHYRNIMKKYKTNKIVVAVAQAIRTGVI